MAEIHWWLTRDGDVTCKALHDRHYSRRRYRGGRKPKLFAGPGEKIVLRTAAGDALFVWRKFVDSCIDERTGERQAGVNCAVFRNESEIKSSDLIRQADAIADFCWPGERHYTYVNPQAVGSRNPGFCFLCAGWVAVRDTTGRRARTKGGLLIFERMPT